MGKWPPYVLIPSQILPRIKSTNPMKVSTIHKCCWKSCGSYATGPASYQVWQWSIEKLVSHYKLKTQFVPMDKTSNMINMDMGF